MVINSNVKELLRWEYDSTERHKIAQCEGHGHVNKLSKIEICSCVKW